MALIIPSFPNKFNPDHPFSNAYAWMAGIALDISQGAGRLTLNINPNANAWASPPIDQIGITLGEVLVQANPSADPPVAEVKFPTLTELMANEEFAAAYNKIGLILYEAAMAHSKLTGSTSDLPA